MRTGSTVSGHVKIEFISISNESEFESNMSKILKFKYYGKLFFVKEIQVLI